MPGWSVFPSADPQLVHYIKTFAPVYADDKPGASWIWRRSTVVARKYCQGQGAFTKTFECYVSRHGWTWEWPAGAGWAPGRLGRTHLAGKSHPAVDVSWGMLRRDIFRNIALGINGTPDGVWGFCAARCGTEADLAHGELCQSCGRAAEPEVKSVLVAKRVKEALPTTPDDAAWKTVPRIIIRWWDKSSRNRGCSTR